MVRGRKFKIYSYSYSERSSVLVLLLESRGSKVGLNDRAQIRTAIFEYEYRDAEYEYKYEETFSHRNWVCGVF